MNPTREQFAAIADRPDDQIDVAAAALWIAKEEYPALEPRAYLRRLDHLAEEVRSEIHRRLPPEEQVARLNRFLFEECGFSGNHDDYYDPRNSFLNEVIDRRLGIPISLCMVYCAVAERLGMPVRGIGFPGHFLCKYVGSPDIIIDPFFGTTVDLEECRSRVRAAYGPRTKLDAQWLAPAKRRDILVRLLTNLKQIYVEKHDSERALGCADRILLLQPDSPFDLRDRGLLYQRLECFAGAIRDLKRYLELAPDDEAADVVRSLLPDLQRQAAQVQ